MRLNQRYCRQNQNHQFVINSKPQIYGPRRSTSSQRKYHLVSKIVPDCPNNTILMEELKERTVGFKEG